MYTYVRLSWLSHIPCFPQKPETMNIDGCMTERAERGRWTEGLKVVVSYLNRCNLLFTFFFLFWENCISNIFSIVLGESLSRKATTSNHSKTSLSSHPNTLGCWKNWTYLENRWSGNKNKLKSWYFNTD